MEKNTVKITYCPKCNWLLRAAWMGQELMLTFDTELLSLSIEKGLPGSFKIYANETEVWDRKREGRFPEITELKQRVRDVIAPNKPLGHSDKKST